MFDYIVHNCKYIDEKYMYYYQYCDFIKYLSNQSGLIMNGFEGIASIGGDCKAIFDKIIDAVCEKQFRNMKRKFKESIYKYPKQQFSIRIRMRLEYFGILSWIGCLNC